MNNKSSKIIVFPKVARQLQKDGLKRPTNVLADNINPLSSITKKIWIRFRTVEEFQKRRSEVEALYTGGRDICTFYIEENNRIVRKEQAFNITDVRIKLILLFGEDNVVVTK